MNLTIAGQVMKGTVDFVSMTADTAAASQIEVRRVEKTTSSTGDGS